jgi:hypothetical protein
MDLTLETAQVFEAFETELSMAQLPRSFSAVLSSRLFTANRLIHLFFFYLSLTSENI